MVGSTSNFLAFVTFESALSLNDVKLFHFKNIGLKNDPKDNIINISKGVIEYMFVGVLSCFQKDSEKKKEVVSRRNGN